MNLYKRFSWWTYTLLLLVMMLGLGLAPKGVGAHASLLTAVPEVNSKLQVAPQSIRLTFNERLDNGLFYIKVFDQQGDEVANEPAKMAEQQTVVEIPLPKLGEGIYIISYHVISADGHPVSGSYPMTIGNPPQPTAAPATNTSPVLDPHEHGGASSFSISMVIQYLSRGLWYLTMLALTGWIVWLRVPKAGGQPIRKELQFWTQNLQRAHLIAVLLLIFTHIEDLLGNAGGDQILSFFLGTSVGNNWLALVGITIIGFIVLQRYLWLDMLWVAALLAVKSFNGHAITFSPKVATVLLDFIHLGASAIWVGGLVMLAARWNKNEAGTHLFLKSFSNWALAAIIVLTLSGSILVLLFLPNLKYLTYSTWGTLLLVKIGVVVLVAIVAGILRFYMKKQRENHVRMWFKIDFSLMLAILVLVGFISYMAPIPTNKPLGNWHVMGETIHMSADITPKVQGTNTFMTKVWLPEKLGKPKQVQMILKYKDDEDIAPIEVPLAPYEDKVQEESYGFVKHSYKTEGAYLPLRGGWTLEIRVMDSEDNETVYENSFIVY
jgi:copper transport protein